MVDGLLEQQPSPFKRLKKVDVHCNRESFKVPAHVTNYLLAGTTGQELYLEVITFHFISWHYWAGTISRDNYVSFPFFYLYITSQV